MEGRHDVRTTRFFEMQRTQAKGCQAELQWSWPFTLSPSHALSGDVGRPFEVSHREAVGSGVLDLRTRGQECWRGFDSRIQPSMRSSLLKPALLLEALCDLAPEEEMPRVIRRALSLVPEILSPRATPQESGQPLARLFR